MSLNELEVKEKNEIQAKSYDISKLHQSIPVPSLHKLVKTLYAFDGREADELHFGVGEVIQVTDDTHRDWWKGFLQNDPQKIGLFPRSYTSIEVPNLSAITEAQNSHNSSGVSSDQQYPQIEEFCRIMDRAKLTSTALRFKNDIHLKVLIFPILKLKIYLSFFISLGSLQQLNA